MRRMNSSLLDLIYLDPPFNPNGNNLATIGDGGQLAKYNGEDLPCSKSLTSKAFLRCTQRHRRRLLLEDSDGRHLWAGKISQ